MAKLIDLTTFPVKHVLGLLLKDKTTKQNIVFATESYMKYGSRYSPDAYISEDILLGMDACEIQPRIAKAQQEQAARTKKKAEVFTPAWICNKMNNHCDAEWFGFENVFNIEDGTSWKTNEDPIRFPDHLTWKQYIDSKRLEITCGEAPYIVSRYDAATGEPIAIKDRIGILDRKLRVVGENAETEEDWMLWAIRAYQSVYGYEYQGDNLLIARINLLITFADYMQEKWGREPSVKEVRKIANIICWNIWQMDGLSGTVPVIGQNETHQISIFDLMEDLKDEKKENVPCEIYDWRGDERVLFNSLKEK